MVAEEYLKAGAIARKVREEVRRMYLIGMSYLDVVEFVERRIREEGGEPGFPCNISVNEVTAHYTPFEEDGKVVKDGDVVKIDLGVHINGYIADTAVTVCYNDEHLRMLGRNEEALTRAIRLVRDGELVGRIGKEIEDTAHAYGYKPIANLGGHGIGRYRIHTGKSIPNVWVPSEERLRSGEVIAIEPFFTTGKGAGYVIEGGIGNIYSLLRRKKLKGEAGRLLDLIWERYKTMPFTSRWLKDEFPNVRELLGELVKKKFVRAYPVLVEANGEVTTQAEHTMIVGEGGATVIT